MDEETEGLIKSRSIRQKDNPETYKERLKELHSSDFENAVHAYGIRKLTNIKNIEKLTEHASDTKNCVFMVNALDVIVLFFFVILEI